MNAIFLHHHSNIPPGFKAMIEQQRAEAAQAEQMEQQKEAIREELKRRGVDKAMIEPEVERLMAQQGGMGEDGEENV